MTQSTNVFWQMDTLTDFNEMQKFLLTIIQGRKIIGKINFFAILTVHEAIS
jgi:hypothetical protein